eukprot:CAMPEP_0168734460 /NCGR_PEP_ID=MMETSP0724-20121128/8826_1 /TAXON_ID=265536 /ORGANISM="Amphiprora sp., Strain CCMP467" /LENGTH=503 /DNA_ID=CAMNT_0008781567 /DNA_START=121 /DNA_END=1629 /DNA_ORIENTATION=+
MTATTEPTTEAEAAPAAAATTAPEESAPQPTPQATPQPAAKAPSPAKAAPPSKKGGPKMPTVDQALTSLEQMVQEGRLPSQHDKNCLKVLLTDHDGLKDKIGKLKSLLGRSSKAQREAKMELETTKKRLQEATREVERLNQKVDKLATRPTHMDLLADFETNFDRALLSVNQQAGGESTAPTPVEASSSPSRPNEPAVVDSLLMQELQESKTRNEKLESLNSALLQRSAQLENESKERRRERDELLNKITHLELEKRMAVMEAEHATKAMEEKAASLAEMQMEIDMVSKASVKAQRRAAKDEELIKSVKTDQRHVQELESQVQALQEWATASAEAKALAQDRVRLLEAQLLALQQEHLGAAASALSSSSQAKEEKVLWEGKGSLVIGAGDMGFRVFEYDSTRVTKTQRVVCRWQFDLTAEELSVEFSAFQGKCETKEDRKSALGSGRALIVDRVVQGGDFFIKTRALFCGLMLSPGSDLARCDIPFKRWQWRWMDSNRNATRG